MLRLKPTATLTESQQDAKFSLEEVKEIDVAAAVFAADNASGGSRGRDVVCSPKPPTVAAGFAPPFLLLLQFSFRLLSLLGVVSRSPG